MSLVVYDDFKSACENGDLETVMKLFDKFNLEFESDMLLMRNRVSQKGYLNILEYFYRHGVDLKTFYEQHNPLTLAAGQGWVDITDFLLEKGLNINLQNFDGLTVLMVASGYGNIDIIDRLFATGQCNANIENIFGDTALFIATERGRPETVDRLVVYGANYYLINHNGQNLLHYTINSLHIDTLQKVLSLGVDVNHQNNRGWTPLMCAIDANEKKMSMGNSFRFDQ